MVVVARNAEQTIKQTLNSIMHQTLPALRIIVVDDGSTDATAEILGEYVHLSHGLVRTIKLPNKGYDIRRVPANINLSSKSASKSGLQTDFFMISGDDCSYPRNYTQSLITRMSKSPRLVVASGRPASGGVTNQEHTPSGSGRMIKGSYWSEVGARYPLKAGWETWLLYEAQARGFKVKLFDDLVFDHARPRGAKHQFVYWGAAMQTLGYHPLYAMGRIAKNAMVGSIALRGSLNFFRGYVQAGLGSEDFFMAPFEPSLRHFVRSSQGRQIANVIGGLQ